MKTLIVASLLFIASGVVKAQETPQAHKRQQHQHARIRAGMTSGKLTRGECKILRME